MFNVFFISIGGMSNPLWKMNIDDLAQILKLPVKVKRVIAVWKDPAKTEML